jgi:hypothetical protein
MWSWLSRRAKVYPRLLVLEQLEDRIVLDASVPAVDHCNSNENSETRDPGETDVGPCDAPGGSPAPSAPADPLTAVHHQDLN